MTVSSLLRRAALASVLVPAFATAVGVAAPFPCAGERTCAGLSEGVVDAARTGGGTASQETAKFGRASIANPRRAARVRRTRRVRPHDRSCRQRHRAPPRRNGGRRGARRLAGEGLGGGRAFAVEAARKGAPDRRRGQPADRPARHATRRAARDGEPVRRSSPRVDRADTAGAGPDIAARHRHGRRPDARGVRHRHRGRSERPGRRSRQRGGLARNGGDLVGSGTAKRRRHRRNLPRASQRDVGRRRRRGPAVRGAGRLQVGEGERRPDSEHVVRRATAIRSAVARSDATRRLRHACSSPRQATRPRKAIRRRTRRSTLTSSRSPPPT